jgi:ABC-2 type transport system ATP-binding protein
MNLLSVRHMTKRFGAFTANEDVDFSVAAGEVVGLLGANGAGKTTAIRQALGIMVPTEGVVLHFGESPSIATRRRIGYLPQDLGLWTDLTVRANLEFAAHAYGVDSRHAEDALTGDLRTVDARLVRDLGLGRQRRVGFAAALSHEPELLVLDEPTSGVDALSRSRLWEVIRGRAEQGTGVLVTTHFMDEARQCDRLIVMSQGRVVLRGGYDEIVGDRQVTQVDSGDWAHAFAALDAAGYTCGLVGTAIRVLSDDREGIEAALAHRTIEAGISTSTATLEETMVAVARGA